MVLCCEIESVCGFATWFWLVPLSSGNIAQLKSLGPCWIMPWAWKLPCTVMAHLPPKNAGQHRAAREAGGRGVDALVDVDHVVDVLDDRLLGGAVRKFHLPPSR